jgi:hypothetical protein
MTGNDDLPVEVRERDIIVNLTHPRLGHSLCAASRNARSYRMLNRWRQPSWEPPGPGR